MSEPIDIRCPSCGAEYQIGVELAGHRVRCAECDERFEVEATDGAGEEGVPEGRVWRFRMPGGQTFGPLSRFELDEYLFEGILTAECQLHREGEEKWQWAGEVYPEVPEIQSSASKQGGESEGCRGGLASAGLLERIPSIRDSLPAEHARGHALLDAAVVAEAKEAEMPVSFLGSRTIGLVQSVAFGSQFRDNYLAALPERTNVLVNSLAVVALRAKAEEFYLVAPYSNLEPLPREFFAILQGKLPAPLVLRGGSSAPVWLGEDRSSQGAVATAMRHVETELGDGVVWKWASRDKKTKMQLDWGIQMVPLGCEQFVLIAKTAGAGRKGKLLGIDWFQGQIRHAQALRRELSLPGDCQARFPMHSESGELIARMFGDN